MIKNPQNTKSFSFGYEHPSNAEVTIAQVFSDRDSVVIAYSNDAGAVLDADWFSKAEHPELNDIVREMPNDDVWDMQIILSLLEPVDPTEYAVDYTPAWQWAGPWVDTSKSVFRNAPAAYQAAS